MSSRFDLSQFDFPLDQQQIALRPASPRDSARLLLVVPRSQGKLQNYQVKDLPELLRPGDTLVINTTKVFPARLLGRRSSGGAVEILLLHEKNGGIWVCLGKNLPKPGTTHELKFSRKLSAQVKEQAPDGTWVLHFSLQGKFFWTEVERLGQVPVPPYLKAPLGQRELRASYQTVFAKQRGSAAAPTAGLHFTPALLKKIKARGVHIVPVTLHVGWGTFAPIRETDIRHHTMHVEWGEISAASWQHLQQVRNKQSRKGKKQQKLSKSKNRIIAVGTTALRVVEAAARERRHSGGKWSGWISLFLKPGDKPKLVDSLLTNFHLPKTTLFVLVCALLGTRRAHAVYAEAKNRGYRWASFGDAMLILPK